MSTDAPLRSPLYDLHLAAGAAMQLDAGWEVPAHYGNAQSEAAAARQSAVVADVSHWGRIRVRGEEAGELLVRLGAAGAPRQEDDTVRTVDLRDAAGAILDRARLVRLEDMWLVLTSPAARAKVLERALELAEGLGTKVDDQTEKTAMIACLGPQAAGRLDTVLPIKVSDLADGSARAGSVLIAKYIALRSDIGVGETLGCHGCASQQPCGTPMPQGTSSPDVAPGSGALQGRFWRMEVVLPTMLAGRAWRFITEKAGERRMTPIGTEAMGMLLEK